MKLKPLLALLVLCAVIAGCDPGADRSISRVTQPAGPAAAASSPAAASSTQPVLVLGALAQEIDHVQKALTDRRDMEVGGLKYVTGRLDGRDVIVARGGVGKVNAAMTATLLITRHRPSCVIFTGVAGGIHPDLLPGDIVLAEKTVQHDFGDVVGGKFSVKPTRNPITNKPNRLHLLADPDLVDVAEAAAGRIEFQPISTASGQRQITVRRGIVATGDVFVACRDKCQEIRKNCQADAVEMEGAAVAQVCLQLRVGALIVRSMSDCANEKASADFNTFVGPAARNSATLAVEIIRSLPK